jgi:hypothetical protein
VVTVVSREFRKGWWEYRLRATRMELLHGKCYEKNRFDGCFTTWW